MQPYISAPPREKRRLHHKRMAFHCLNSPSSSYETLPCALFAKGFASMPNNSACGENKFKIQDKISKCFSIVLSGSFQVRQFLEEPRSRRRKALSFH